MYFSKNKLHLSIMKNMNKNNAQGYPYIIIINMLLQYKIKGNRLRKIFLHREDSSILCINLMCFDVIYHTNNIVSCHQPCKNMTKYT
jgi:hypothetical protein